jgi:hypothetical protein
VYHLLVTANTSAWDLPSYEFPRERFLEYTSTWHKEKYGKLSATVIEELTSFPALFTYEGETQDARVGYIRHIRERSRSIQVEYQFESGIPAFPFSKLADLKSQLHIESWEMNRTHWALKDKDLFEMLVSAGLAGSFFTNAGGKGGRVDEMRFKVALSFPGEKRDFVKSVADELKKMLPKGTVFYDNDFTAQLAKPNLDTLLQRIYLQNSDLVVVFLCADYQRKKWCGIEWRAIREIVNNRDDNSLMFMRFDNADVTGVFPHDGYVDLNRHTPIQAAQFILERVRLNDQDTAAS